MSRTGRRRRRRAWRCPSSTAGRAHDGSIWPAIYPELLSLVREHNSTIIFVNNRRSAERVALRLNELAASEDGEQAGGEDGEQAGGRHAGGGGQREPHDEIARAHHGSLAREERTKVEELLKAGGCRAWWRPARWSWGSTWGPSTWSCRSSRRSRWRGACSASAAPVTASARSAVGGSSPSSAATCSSARSWPGACAKGLIEPTVVPRNALDVLAQQIVAIAVAAEGSAAGRGGGEGDGAQATVTAAPIEDGAVSVDELHALVRRTHSYAELSRELLENVLDMLDGRYPSQEFGELRARIVWDRAGGHDPGAQGLAPAGGRQRGHDPRPRPVRGHAPGRPARGGAGRGDGLRGPRRPDLPARRLHAGASRRSGATA